MLEFVRDGSYVIDVGANIGLMAVPVLASRAGVKVLSFEASPETLRFVSRTRDESAFRSRWEIVSKAAGSDSGTAKFSVGPPALGALDGFRNTGRVAGQTEIDVEVTTIDVEWRRRGCPDVSVIKIDVEGAEYDVLLGASECIARWHPAIILEWGLKNIGAYGRNLGDLLEIAKQLGCRVWALPGMTEVHDAIGLRVQASVTESFLLVAASAGESD
jgi:FkbM family methyltransferase